jgi:hypothetical protein
MPISKHNARWHTYLSEELGIPEEAIWVDDTTSSRTNVYIWTTKLSGKQFMQLVGADTAGSPLSKRGKLCRILEQLNANGWMTRVKPIDAKPSDLYPISALSDRRYCSCGSEMLTSPELFRGKCNLCVPVETK